MDLTELSGEPALLWTFVFVLLFWSVLFAARQWLRIRGRPGGKVDVGARLRRLFRSTERADSHPDPELEEQLRSVLWAKRVHLARGLASCYFLIAVGKGVATVAIAVFEISPVNNFMQHGAYLMLLSGFAICALFPWVLCVRSIAFWHVYLMIAGGTFSSPAVIGFNVEYLNTQMMTMCGTTALGFMCLRFPILLATNVMHSALVVVATAIAWDPDVGLSFADCVANEMVCLMMKLAIFRFVTFLVELGARQEVEILAGACQRSAVSSLLEILCDVVVDLDQSLGMKEHVPKLAVMLMHGAGKSLRGSALGDFFVGGEDRRIFERAIQGEGSDDVLSPSVFSVQMRDAIGNSIRTVLHLVPYRSVGGRIHHLVGLSEAADAKADAAMEGGGGVMEEMPAGRAEMPPAVLTDAVVRELGGGRAARPMSGRRSRSTGSSPSSGGRMLDLSAEAWVTDELTVSQVSDHFARRFGKRGSFLEFLPQEVGRRLARWIKSSSQEVVSGQRAPFIGEFGEVEVFRGLRTENWKIEVCFPKLHPELVRRQAYLVGIRLVPPSPRFSGTSPHSLPGSCSSRRSPSRAHL